MSYRINLTASKTVNGNILIMFSGKNYMDKFHLWPLSKGFSDVYLDTIDPRVTNEFAAAAFRFGHSLIPHQFQTGT